MYVLIDKLGIPALQDADNFKAFKLVSELSWAGLQRAFGVSRELGSLGEAPHAWISEHWLRRQAAARDEAWLQKLDAMLAYAREKGWLHEHAVRAHIEYKDAA